MTFKTAQQFHDHVFDKNVVIIEKQEIFASCHLRTVVSRNSLKRIPFIPDIADTTVIAKAFFDSKPCIIGRTVVDDNDLKRNTLLRQHTGNTVADHVRTVVGRNYDGNIAHVLFSFVLVNILIPHATPILISLPYCAGGP